MTSECTTDPAAETGNTTYPVEVSFTVRPHTDAYLQDRYSICAFVGNWLQNLTFRLQTELLDTTHCQVHVCAEALAGPLDGAKVWA